MPPNADRLYDLLPAIHRMRDADRGYPLRDFLRVISEQVNAVEDDITGLYDNWFIETAEDWVVPYLADLVGYTPVLDAGDPSASGPGEVRFLVPRREVANTIAYRRRRGTLAVLEDLAEAVAAWPARAVEFYRLLLWTQNLNHQHSDGFRARTMDLRAPAALEKLGTPFDPFARTVDVRRIFSRRGQGRYNIPSVGVWLWRLQSYSITRGPAYCLEAGKNSFTFSVLGNDAPLFVKPLPEPSPDNIAQAHHRPVPLLRHEFDARKDCYYGPEKSLTIWADWGTHSLAAPVPASAILPADLSNWHYAPPDGFVAVDPQLGRIQFPVNQLPRRSVRVTYHYGFSAAMGGGEYPRTLSQPEGAVRYEVGEHATFKKIGDALAEWRENAPPDAVIEIQDSRAYVEPVQVGLAAGQSLQIRGASGTRPVIRLLDWQTEGPDSLSVIMDAASRFVIDGLLITGRGVSISGVEGAQPAAVCAAEVVIRHTTLVPGWSLDPQCKPSSPNKESIELRNVRARVRIDHSIIGPIEIQEDEVHSDPIPIEILDSIVDAMGGAREAIIGPQAQHAHAVMTIRRSTIFGIVQVHAVQLAEDSIFLDCVHVARRQIGCMRFCYVRPECRTPRRFQCQPDLVMREKTAEAAARESERVRPHFTSRRYGQPAYAQLASQCADAISAGASDGAEMGAFHDLFQPQRLANLRARLDEYTPAGMDAGILLAN